MRDTEAVLWKKSRDLTVSVNGQIASIRCQLEKYIVDNNLKSLVIGVSGGIDSAVCCALARPVCDHLHILLYTRSLPLASKQEEKTRASAVGRTFGHNFSIKDLSRSLTALETDLYGVSPILPNSSREAKIKYGNIKARLRMISLYSLAQHTKGMVLSTDNLTEYLLGFWTLHGDVGDYGMIQDLWKTEVYALAYELVAQQTTDKAAQALKDCIEAVPTDGLGITDSDLDQLEADSYEEVDKLLQAWLLFGPFESEPSYKGWLQMLTYGATTWAPKYALPAAKAVELSKHPVIKRHMATHFKRNNPTNISRTSLKERG